MTYENKAKRVVAKKTNRFKPTLGTKSFHPQITLTLERELLDEINFLAMKYQTSTAAQVRTLIRRGLRGQAHDEAMIKKLFQDAGLEKKVLI